LKQDETESEISEFEEDENNQHQNLNFNSAKINNLQINIQKASPNSKKSKKK